MTFAVFLFGVAMGMGLCAWIATRIGDPR